MSKTSLICPDFSITPTSKGQTQGITNRPTALAYSVARVKNLGLSHDYETVCHIASFTEVRAEC